MISVWLLKLFSDDISIYYTIIYLLINATTDGTDSDAQFWLGVRLLFYLLLLIVNVSKRKAQSRAAKKKKKKSFAMDRVRVGEGGRCYDSATCCQQQAHLTV